LGYVPLCSETYPVGRDDPVTAVPRVDIGG